MLESPQPPPLIKPQPLCIGMGTPQPASTGNPQPAETDIPQDIIIGSQPLTIPHGSQHTGG
jgi:hypothetical protein